MSKASLWVLIPAHNEEHRIGATLESYAAHLERHYRGAYHLVVILNGCRDRTLEVVERAARRHPRIAWIVFEERIGKGGAIIDGLQLAQHADLIGYIDADGATAPESFLRLVALCAEADCVVGSRRLPGSVILRPQPRRRLIAGRVFQALVAGLFQLGVSDTQCGAKVLRREALVRVLEALHIADMAFDINLLYSLKRAGCRVVEAPVEWTDQQGSTVSLFRTSLGMFLSVVRLRLVHSPLRGLVRVFEPVLALVYRALRNPPPRQPAAVDDPARAAGREASEDRMR